MIRTLTLLASLLLLVLWPNVAHAWLRPEYEDATVVERSELIVVAHLAEGSIQYVPHEKKPDEGASWEHHATLVITRVLKGKCDDKETPIIIHYGLTPVVGGYVKRDSFMIDLRGGGSDYPEGIVEIFDTGNSCQGRPSLVKDAREDNLWFLRRRSGLYGREAGTGNYGIVDPEDLRPREQEQYFLSYLSDDPERAVSDYVWRNFDVAERGKKYLDHLAVQRILKTEDPGKRYDGLLPFFLKRTTWNMKSEARVGIVACGAMAGERLKDVFEGPEYSGFRQEIIRMWRDMGYRQVVPLLMDLLKQHDRFWAEQHLQEGWWNDDVASEQTRRRREIYGEVYSGVFALRSFRDARAREVLEMTRERWKAINFDNTQIVEECEAALRELDLAEGIAKPDAPADADKPRP